MKKPWIGLGAGLLAVTMAGPLHAQQPDDLKKEIEELKKGQERILKQLEAIEKKIDSPPRPAAPKGPEVKGIVFDLGDNPVIGSEGAKLTLIELTDYQ